MLLAIQNISTQQSLLLKPPKALFRSVAWLWLWTQGSFGYRIIERMLQILRATLFLRAFLHLLSDLTASNLKQLLWFQLVTTILPRRAYSPQALRIMSNHLNQREKPHVQLNYSLVCELYGFVVLQNVLKYCKSIYFVKRDNYVIRKLISPKSVNKHHGSGSVPTQQQYYI